MRRLAPLMALAMLAGCGLLQPDADLGDASWTFQPGAEIGPDTTEFVAMVTEVACASGMSSVDRIVGPEIDADDGRVIVTFHVRPLAGPQECPSNPPTAVTVRLDAPLGDRELMDGARVPPQTPPECGNPAACE